MAGTKGESREQAGAAFGTSGRTVERAKTIQKAGSKKLVEAVDRDTAAGRRAFRDLASSAEFESDLKSERLRAKHAELRAAGHWPSSSRRRRPARRHRGGLAAGAARPVELERAGGVLPSAPAQAHQRTSPGRTPLLGPLTRRQRAELEPWASAIRQRRHGSRNFRPRSIFPSHQIRTWRMQNRQFPVLHTPPEPEPEPEPADAVQLAGTAAAWRRELYATLDARDTEIGGAIAAMKTELIHQFELHEQAHQADEAKRTARGRWLVGTALTIGGLGGGFVGHVIERLLG